MLIGPPGTGKSMLAQRLPAILPPMTDDEALASAAIQGLTRAGFDPAALGQRPVCAPHHSASAVALVGGGSPPQPGAVSLAHGGVLFLDESAGVRACGARSAARQAHFPARFQLVAAMNPCPCGWLGAYAATGKTCRCTPDAVGRYSARLSGPLLDHIDLLVEVPAINAKELLMQPDGEPSTAVAERVLAARGRQQARQGVANAALDAAALSSGLAIDAATKTFLQTVADRLGWSGRAVHRVLKVARTIADLAGSEQIAVAQLAEGVQYRRSIRPS